MPDLETASRQVSDASLTSLKAYISNDGNYSNPLHPFSSVSNKSSNQGGDYRELCENIWATLREEQLCPEKFERVTCPREMSPELMAAVNPSSIGGTSTAAQWLRAQKKSSQENTSMPDVSVENLDLILLPPPSTRSLPSPQAPHQSPSPAPRLPASELWAKRSFPDHLPAGSSDDWPTPSFLRDMRGIPGKTHLMSLKAGVKESVQGFTQGFTQFFRT